MKNRLNISWAVLTILAFINCGLALGGEITSPSEQKQLVEILSGAGHYEYEGLSDVIFQRFSDSPEVFTTARFLKANYGEIGLNAEVVEYDPLDAFPYYFQDTDSTYRNYFNRMIPMLKSDFDGLCAQSLTPERRETVMKRLARVGLGEVAICKTEAKDRVELYISTTIRHTTEMTRAMLTKRSLTTWPNVIATIRTSTNERGEAGERPLCVIGAHMDSVARDGGGRGPILSPATRAPGADDNASGTAAVLTLAKGLKHWIDSTRTNLSCDLAFVHFSGEEEGLLGSLAFTHLQNRAPIVWMVNFDMVAYNKSANPIMNVGYDQRFGNQLTKYFYDQSASLKTLLIERNTFIYSSDQIAFWGIGVPAISISEQACSDLNCSEPFRNFNPFLHTPEDTSDKLDFDYAANVVENSFKGLKRLLTDR